MNTGLKQIIATFIITVTGYALMLGCIKLASAHIADPRTHLVTTAFTTFFIILGTLYLLGRALIAIRQRSKSTILYSTSLAHLIEKEKAAEADRAYFKNQTNLKNKFGIK